MENNYSIKEVIEERFGEIKYHLLEIKEQTTKTNGRVSVLENHRSYLWGAFTLLTLLGTILISLSVQAIDSKIDKKINETLSNYEVHGVEVKSK